MATTVEVYSVTSGDTTGAFLAFGSLLDPRIVFLHPPTTADLQPGDRARCRIRTAQSRLTIEGSILPAPEGVEFPAPVAVQLDVAFAGDIGEVEVPQGPGHPTAQEAADAVMAFVSTAAKHDPRKPSGPPPTGPDVSERQPHPGRRPWYCVICPGAFGC